MDQMNLKNGLFLISILSIIFLFTTCVAGSNNPLKSNNPVVGDLPQKVEDHFIPEPAEYKIQSWVENLRIPWELIFLSENKAMGDIPDDNPFTGSPVYSLGFRNPQGLAWYPKTGVLFSSNHGPSGEFGLQGKDTINVIKKGSNYGWPLVLGNANFKPYIAPIIMWSQATLPSGMTFWNNRLYIATLRSETLLRIDIEPSGESYQAANIDRLFANDLYHGTYGRLRDAVVGTDNALYVLTNNYDGRGTPQPGDDKILRLTLK